MLELENIRVKNIKTKQRGSMKKLVLLLVAIPVLLFVSGCSSVIPMGVFHTNTTLPAQVVNKGELPDKLKVGTSTSTSYFAVVCVGDASIDKAVKNGNIKKISYVDWKVTNPWYIGVKTVYTTTVYGE